MRVRDDPSVVEMVVAVGVWRQSVENEHISFLSTDRRKLLAIFDVAAQHTVVDGRVEALGMVVKSLDDAYRRQLNSSTNVSLTCHSVLADHRPTTSVR